MPHYIREPLMNEHKDFTFVNLNLELEKMRKTFPTT